MSEASYELVEDEREIRDVEYLILLILGKADRRISILHLQKIFFTLWRFHPQVKRLVDFVPHLRGPFSFDLDELIKNPTYATDCWEYLPPKRSSEAERVKGGYLVITEKGEEIYKKIVAGLNEKAKEDEDTFALISAVDLIVPLYTRLEWDELLLLLYTDENIKEYSERSELSRDIIKNSEKIIDRLIKKGMIDEEKQESLIERIRSAGWIR